MNSAELKLEIIRQVDLLEVDVLNEIREYIQNRLKIQSLKSLEGLSESEIERLKEAQESLQLGRGLSYEEIKSKYKIRYGIA